MHLLGSTVGQIATEKAGIIKRGCPVISSAVHPEARRVIESTAARRRAPLVQLGRDFEAVYLPADGSDHPADPLAPGCVAVTMVDTPTAQPLVFPLAMRGGHQAINAAVVVMAARSLDARGIRVSDRAVAKGLRTVSLPARIERIAEKPLVILDAAHNVASMESLVATLAPAALAFRPTVLLFAASADKQITEMLTVARGRFDHVVITRYATNPRAATVSQLVEACHRAGLPAPQVATAPAEALRLARSLATPRGLVCVAGSFFLAAEIRAVM
jgi:dihydrofolate synthase/folylpolyglutamate synthase